MYIMIWIQMIMECILCIFAPLGGTMAVVFVKWMSAKYLNPARHIKSAITADWDLQPDEKDTRVNYADYLKLDQLLSSQELMSEKVGGHKAHDELLFIVTHQAYELWFKEIIHEVDTVRDVFRAEDFDEAQTLFVISCLHRIVAILKLLKDQILILETMTPLGFMEFRNYLAPASGFQSQQFRLLENKLGLTRAARIQMQNQEYSKLLRSGKDRQEVDQSEKEPSLQELVQKWLSRTPGLEADGFNFWGKYKRSVHAWMKDLQAEAKNALSKQMRTEKMKSLKGTVETFETIFNEERHNQLVARGERKFSHKALQGALMISFYRDEPRFNQPYQILNLLMDIDSLLIKWRYNHVMIVQRTLGSKAGTGGSSGYQYLRSTISDRYKIFLDLFNLSNYLVPRDRIPLLTSDMRTRLSSMSVRNRSESDDSANYSDDEIELNSLKSIFDEVHNDTLATSEVD